MALPKNPKADLKKKYLRTFETGLILSLLIIIFSFRYFPEFQREHSVLPLAQELITIEDVLNTKIESPPPPPPKPPIPVEAPSEDQLPDIEIEPTEIDFNKTPPPPPPPPPDEIQDYSKIFTLVEEYPQPVGGLAAIQKKIVYPEFAVRAGIQGKVFVTAIIDEQGNVISAEVTKGIGGGCDEAAVKAVMATKFKPGKQRGRAVKVQLSLPIFFKLK